MQQSTRYLGASLGTGEPVTASLYCTRPGTLSQCSSSFNTHVRCFRWCYIVRQRNGVRHEQRPVTTRRSVRAWDVGEQQRLQWTSSLEVQVDWQLDSLLNGGRCVVHYRRQLQRHCRERWYGFLWHCCINFVLIFTLLVICIPTWHYTSLYSRVRTVPWETLIRLYCV